MAEKYSTSEVKELLKHYSGKTQPETIKSYLETGDLADPRLQDLLRTYVLASKSAEDKQQLSESLTDEVTAICRIHEKMLEYLGICTESLSEATKETLEAMASTGTALGLLKVNPPTVAIELSRLEEEEISLEYELTMADYRATILQFQLTEILHSQENIEKLPDLKNRVHSAQAAKEADFWTKKMSGYERKISQLKARLSQSGYQPALEHAAVLKLAEEANKLRSELLVHKEKIDSYHNLPPDPSKALDELNTARAKLHELEEQFVQRVQNVNL